MPPDQSIDILLQQAKNLYQLAVEFLSKGGRDNAGKYLGKVKAEISFLGRLQNDPTLLNHIKASSSNFMYLDGLFQLIRAENTSSLEVFKTFPAGPIKSKTRNGSLRKLTVDLVCDDGLRWIKLRTCNSFDHKIKDDEWSSDSAEGTSTEIQTIPPIIKQAMGLKNAALGNEIHFRVPTVQYVFLRMRKEDFPENILRMMVESEIKVSFGMSEKHALEPYHYHTSTLNLDVTTMIAMVSDISHRLEQIPIVAFDSTPLKMQYEMEAKSPILPILSQIFNGKNLVCCQSAFEKFESIVSTIGGPFERARARLLFPDAAFGSPREQIDHIPFPKWNLEIVPNQTSPRFQQKDSENPMTDLNMNVFGTGDCIQASTITSNQSFKRSLENSGFAEFITIHEPRGLIEQKWLKCK